MIDIFGSRHIEWLYQQIKDERAAHAKELERVLSENKRLCDENERLRLTLGQPSRMAEVVEPPKPVDPDAMPIFTGSPWEKILQRESWLQSPAGKTWATRQLAKLKIEEPESGEKREH